LPAPPPSPVPSDEGHILKITPLVIVTTNALVPVVDLIEEISPSYSSCRKRLSNRLGYDKEPFPSVGRINIASRDMSTHDMAFLVYLSIFFLGWLIGTLAGRSTGDDVKYWSWIIVHA
jgi:hypothetical protein